MFLITAGREFQEIASLYRTLCLYFSQPGMIVLNRGAVLALVFTFLMSNKSIHSFFYTCNSINVLLFLCLI